MHYRDYLYPGDQEEYSQELVKYKSILDTCVRYATDAFYLVSNTTEHTNRGYHDSTIHLLARHIIECADGMSVLVAEGCVQNCYPLLRSEIEAFFQFQYILQADTDRRGTAYQVATLHDLILHYRRHSPDDEIGKSLHDELSKESPGRQTKWQSREYEQKIKLLECELQSARFAPIQAEWVAIKQRTKKRPSWYTLFGGPSNIRELAKCVGNLSLYEFLYKPLSSSIHAGDVFKHVGKTEVEGEIAIRHLRQPEGIENVCGACVTILHPTVSGLVERYAPHEKEAYLLRYKTEVLPTMSFLRGGKTLSAPWKVE